MRSLLLVFLSFIIPVSAQIAPCVEQSLSAYLGTECTFYGGVLTAKGFFFDADSFGTDAILATAGDILVTPPVGGSSGFEFTSSLFALSEGQRAVYQLHYIVDPPPPVFPGFEDFMYTRTPVAPGFAHLTTELCAGGTFGAPPVFGESSEPFCQGTGLIYRQLEVFHRGTGTGNQLFDSITFPTLQNFIDVRNFLELNAADGGSSSLDGFGNRTLVSPEPGAFLLAGAGLVVLMLRRRRHG